jgi:hypothetical protein
MPPVAPRSQLLSDFQRALIEDLLPVRTGKDGRPFSDARAMVAVVYRCAVALHAVITWTKALSDMPKAAWCSSGHRG